MWSLPSNHSQEVSDFNLVTRYIVHSLVHTCAQIVRSSQWSRTEVTFAYYFNCFSLICTSCLGVQLVKNCMYSIVVLNRWNFYIVFKMN